MLAVGALPARHPLEGRPCGSLRRHAAALRAGRKVGSVRVASRYTAGGGASPPQQQQAPPPVPPPAQQAAQRPPVPQGRRVGPGAVPPPSYQQPQQPYQQQAYQQQAYQQPPQQQFGSSTLQRFSAAAAAATAPQQQWQEPATINVQQPAAADGTEFVLPRSKMMDLDVITRTSGRRLGYIHQMYVDPGSLAVVSLYLREQPSSLGASATQHVMLSSLREISDVALVHDERALMDPAADDSMGFCRLVGAEVVTERGQSLGRVRDFLFDPDTGAISTIKYDRLGLPSLPQFFFSCYSISWEDVVALGPTRLIVRAGTEARAIKENEGIVDEGLSALVDIIVGPPSEEGKAGAAAAPTGAAPMPDAYRSDPAYVAWYAQFGEQYGQYTGTPVQPPGPPAGQQPQRRQQQQQAPPPQQPRALPPPQTSTFAQAVQPQIQQQQQQPAFNQAFQQQRQAVPAGAVGSGWGAPPPPPQQQRAYTPPPQPQQQPPLSPYQQRPQAGGQQQQQQQQFRPSAGGPAPQQAQQRPPAQQQAIPQNGIPIIDRTPLPPHRRRDADGNYGPAPAAGAPAGQRQQPAPGWGGAAQAQQPPAQQQQRQQQRAPQPPPLVEPDAVIPGGQQQQRPSGSSGGAGGGLRQPAEYRQL